MSEEEMARLPIEELMKRGIRGEDVEALIDRRVGGA
jgi:hypothetical protein